MVGQSAMSGAARKASIAATNAGAWVWWAACRAPSIMTTRPFRSRASRARVAAANAVAARPAEDLEDGLADRAEDVERAAGDRLGPQLADRRVDRRRAAGPDRVGPEGGEIRLRHPDDVAHERGERFVPIARGDERRDPPDRARVLLVATLGSRRRALVADDAPEVGRPKRRAERDPAAVRVPDDVDRPARFGRDRVHDRGEVVELALDRVRLAGRSVIGRAPPAAIDGVERVAGGQQRSARSPGRMVGRGAVDEDDRRSARAHSEAGDRDAVRGRDPAVGLDGERAGGERAGGERAGGERAGGPLVVGHGRHT